MQNLFWRSVELHRDAMALMNRERDLISMSKSKKKKKKKKKKKLILNSRPSG
jgi:hypothetical protein